MTGQITISVWLFILLIIIGVSAVLDRILIHNYTELSKTILTYLKL